MSTDDTDWVSDDEIALRILAKEAWDRGQAIELARKAMCITHKYKDGNRNALAFRYDPLVDTHIAVCFMDECALVRDGKVIDYCCAMDMESSDLTIKWQRALLDHDLATLRTEMVDALGVLSQSAHDG